MLRDGRDVGSLACRDASEAEIITMIAGTALPAPAASGGRAPGRAVLSVRDLSAGILSGIDLDVAAGEIVGVAGLLGSGRSTLLRAIFGGLPRADPGRFNVLGTVIGVLFVAVAVSGLTLAGVSDWVQPVFNGCALIVAIGLSTYLARRRRGKDAL